MWKLFKRRRVEALAMPGILERLSTAIHRRQKRYADFLQVKSATFSRRKLTVLLIVFCIVFGGSSLYVLVSAFVLPGKSFRITHITVPIPINTDRANERQPEAMPPISANRIRSFQQYMDSLHNAPDGKRLYDSIISERPGLMDSVNTAIRLFESSKN